MTTTDGIVTRRHFGETCLISGLQNSIPFVTTGHNPARFRIPFDGNLSALNFIAQCEPLCLWPLALQGSIYLTVNIEESEITLILKGKTSL